jgi:phosphopantetheine--protein transferase-like protein
MEEKIKEIVAVFLKIPGDQIGDQTAIDRTALGSSILMHRMYARLGEEGIVIGDYAGIKVFGDIMQRQQQPGTSPVVPAAPVTVFSENGAAPGIGIDIEEVAALPRSADIRKEAFYTQNYTPAEMAYCILQADPYASLTGLFAAKEAIVKAEASVRNNPFNTLEIGHTTEGKPLYPGFNLSISHAGGLAVAVAIRQPGAWPQAPPPPVHAPAAGGQPGNLSWVSWLALLLATVALLIALKH